MKFNILLVKETRAKEARVALIPIDVARLIKFGHRVFVESNAGKEAGFTNIDYEQAGANICIINNSLSDYQKLFANINIIIRVKRANIEREKLECASIVPGTIMVGALDPLERHSHHIKAYHDAKIIAYSIDQLKLKPNDSMNILAAMSNIAGRLALLDAIAKFHGKVKKAVIIGFGIAGSSAFEEAIRQGIKTTVIISNKEQAKQLSDRGADVVILDRDCELSIQQSVVKRALIDADIVISGARHVNKIAPILIPLDTLNSMQSGAVVVDMALSEGGNVEGSEHDTTHILGNNVIVTNVSGYPKVVPHEASVLWSRANLRFIELLAEDINNPRLTAAIC